MKIILFFYFHAFLVCFALTSTEEVDINQNMLSKKYSTGARPLIVGGKKARPGEFKGVVAIKISRRGGPYELHCGGTLIRPSVVLTAAHCFVSRSAPVSLEMFIIIGDDLKVKETDASPSRQYRNISRISMHERYDDNSRNFHDDIALIVVATPFVLTEAFRPVKVTNVAPVVNELCRVAGWGRLGEKRDHSEVLMAVNIPVISTEICNSAYPYIGGIAENSICAGYMDGGRDSCQGDSGGGLICGDVVKGIVSWGIGCARQDQPGVYTDVYQYRDWIMKNSGISVGQSDRTSLHRTSFSNPVTPMFAMSALTILLFGMTGMLPTVLI